MQTAHPALNKLFPLICLLEAHKFHWINSTMQVTKLMHKLGRVIELTSLLH